jgi:hypothetical protein
MPGSPRVDQGWTVVAIKAVPELGPHVCNSKIHFGVLLGAGSFGRVYRGDACCSWGTLERAAAVRWCTALHADTPCSSPWLGL